MLSSLIPSSGHARIDPFTHDLLFAEGDLYDCMKVKTHLETDVQAIRWSIYRSTTPLDHATKRKRGFRIRFLHTKFSIIEL